MFGSRRSDTADDSFWGLVVVAPGVDYLICIGHEHIADEHGKGYATQVDHVTKRIVISPYLPPKRRSAELDKAICAARLSYPTIVGNQENGE